MTMKAKEKVPAAKRLSTYEFDTSKYVVIRTPLRREAASGRLIVVHREPNKK